MRLRGRRTPGPTPRVAGAHHGPSPAIMARTAWLGTRRSEARATPVRGESRLRRSQSSMAARSYVWPSIARTGSDIRLSVMGQRSSSGTAGGG